MKRTLAIAFFAATMIMASTGASAQTRSKADIPFDFSVGSTLMPSGTYIVSSPEPGTIWLHQQNGRANAMSVAVSGSSTEAPAKLIFNKYGDQYFLHETRTNRGATELTLPVSKVEKRARTLEAQIKSEQQTVIALK